MRDRYTITTYSYLVDYEAADADLTDTETARGDLSEALAALEGDSWDDIDQNDATVILYPADWQQDYRTGDVTYDNIVIVADRAENLDRLMSVYQARETARRARFDAYMRGDR